MSRKIGIAFIALALLGVVTAARASTIGPYDDLQTVISGSSSARDRATGGGTKGGWDIKDATKVFLDVGSPDAFVRAAAYATSATDDFQSGSVVITTIYGVDVVPGASALRIGGFNPAAPEIGSIFGEEIIGLSGKIYPATLALTPTLADLSQLLPGFDLTPFEGSPTSFFYLFQTSAPVSAFRQ